MSAKTTGIILVDHGSRRAESNAMLLEVVATFERNSDYAIVEPAHMELAEPSISTAFGLCVEHGATLIVVHPYFLLPGRHWDQDIPRLAAAAAKAYPAVPYLVTAPLGVHEQMADIIKDRIQHCLGHANGQAEECDLCVGTDRCQLRHG